MDFLIHFIQTVLIVTGIIASIFTIWYMFKDTDSSCNYNCNQGRNCTCRKGDNNGI